MVSLPLSLRALRLSFALLLAVLLLASSFNVSLAAPSSAPAGEVFESPLTYGWYEGRSTFYYNFENPIPSADGGATITPAPIYVLFYDDGTPVPNQRNIIDVVPGDAGYSDLWQVHQVTVPDDYVADSARSHADIVAAGYPVTPLEMFVNCPVVPEGSTLQYSQQGLTQGWYQEEPVFYFAFGLNPTTSAPIYVLFYDDGTPVSNQRNIIDVVPGDTGYSAFWRVNMVTVPDDYEVNSVRSLAEIEAAGYTVTETSILVNCPVVRTEEEAASFTPVAGWFNGAPIHYYNFSNPVPSADAGETVTPAPIYVLFYDDGTPVPNQHNIIDVVPGDAGYSDLWQVHRVTVPDGYVPDTIRSVAQLESSGYPIEALEMFVNCPVVPEGSTLANGPALTQGWYRGQTVFYPDFGLNPVQTAPIYVLVYDDGMMVPGQQNIINTVPGMAGYSAFWRVHMVTVPDDYEVNSLTSAAALVAAGYPMQATAIIVNCPVVNVEPMSVQLASLEAGGPAGQVVPLGAVALSLLLGGAVWRRGRARRAATL
jgi:D-ribose pyranose/furanose isomerase RbsD